MKAIGPFKQISIFHSLVDKILYQNIHYFNESEDGNIEENNHKNPSALYNSDYGIYVSQLITFAVSSSNPLNSSTSEGANKTKPKLDWSNKKILIVEDDDANYLFLEYALRKTNINIIRAVDGLQAVKACKETQHFDLVLMDIQLPIMDGYDATSEIRNFKKELPIIAQTAYAQQTDKDKCLECGCNEFITKPIDRDELIELINKYIKD